MVEVGAYPSRVNAEVAQAALSVAGISSVVEADDAGGAYPFDLTGGVRLAVAERDVGDAVAVLAASDTNAGGGR
jgi:hypothetical protein